jgi:hypothetical protein
MEGLVSGKSDQPSLPGNFLSLRDKSFLALGSFPGEFLLASFLIHDHTISSLITSVE